jgi:hypothetical protein
MTTPTVGRAEYLSAADTAKLVRKALARAFPDYTFRVTSSTYAGGASIDVSWYDGPPERIVRGVTSAYAGGGFDGMIDLAYNVDSWLMPDGSAQLAYSPGTTGSRGVHESILTDPPSPDARLVSFGADHVLCQRDLTPEARVVIERKTVQKFGADYLAALPEYDRSRLEHETASRWLFPPCALVFSVVRGYGPNRVTEAENMTSLSAATKHARELEKARNPRGSRHVTAHRPTR